MTFKGVDHIVVRVKDLDAGIANWRDNFGLTLDRTSESVELGMKQAFFNLDNGGFIEVVAPLSDDSPVAKAIESRGEGLHVMAMEVEDRDATVKQLEANGVKLIGVGTSQVFIHPKSANGMLVQLTPKA
jgi:methylmalonyl-CoA epimerase